MKHVGRNLSRRSVLRGAGALMALPFLESIAAPLVALGATGDVGKPPLRMAIFTVTGGTVIESWRMKQGGPLTRLPSILRPLEFCKDELLLISGLSHNGRGEGVNAHDHCAMLHLTGADQVRKIAGKMIGGVSVDQAAAQAVGDDTFLPSLELGLEGGGKHFCFRAPDQPLPFESNPRLVFERMFRGRKPVVPNWSHRTPAAIADSVRNSARGDSRDRSVLDLVMNDASDLRGKLGRNDQRKLDEYLDSVRSVEKRVDFAEARQRIEVMDAACPGPSKLNLPDHLPAPGTSIWKITGPVEQDPDRHQDYIRLMADLMILALQTDTTRVATLSAGSDEALFPGVVTVGYERHSHTLEHQGNAGRVEDADPIAREACRQIHAWYTQLFAEMVRKMKGIDEGGSSLLDNTMLMYTSYMADGGHGRNDYPILLAGRAGGSLKTGRQLVYQDQTPVSNLYVEMLNRMGVKTDRFGDSATAEHAAYGGRLPGLV